MEKGSLLTNLSKKAKMETLVIFQKTLENNLRKW